MRAGVWGARRPSRLGSVRRRGRRATPGGRSRRRDLTVNAIAWDPLLRVYEDPFQGRADLDARRLRAVDRDTFGEDPLRALRVAQFAARFDFGVAPELEALCAAMPLEELPSERVRGEVEKLILKGKRVCRGWDLAWRTGMWRVFFPISFRSRPISALGMSVWSWSRGMLPASLARMRSRVRLASFSSTSRKRSIRSECSRPKNSRKACELSMEANSIARRKLRSNKAGRSSV